MTKDLTNKKFGKLTAKYKAPNIISNNCTYSSWYCECSCGNVCIASSKSLLNNSNTSCGCDASKLMSISDIKTKPPKAKTKRRKLTNNVEKTTVKKSINIQDISGQRFGKLVVLPKYEVRELGRQKTKITYWLCKCDCGTEKFINVYNLHSGNTTSCGCHRSNVSKNSPITRNRSRTLNKYDLDSKPYGIGYCSNDESEFYFDKEDYDKIKDYTWSNSGNYIISNVDGKIRHIETLIISAPENKHIAHINGSTSYYDNRKSNLRVADSAQVQWNREMMSNNKSGVTGVYYNKANGSWMASIMCYGKRFTRAFNCKADAIKQRKTWEEVMFGDFSYDKSRNIEE